MTTNGNVDRIVATIAAIALSGIAVADHKPGHDRGNGQGPGPKVSIDITNLCQLGAGSANNPVPKNVLRVTTTVEDVSDDPRREVDVDTISVAGLQFVEPLTPPKKNKWINVGLSTLVTETLVDMYTVEYVRDVDLCQAPTLDVGAKALNAHVQVMLPDGRNFMRMCDDPFLEGDDLDGDGSDDVDQSKIDLEDYPDVGCP